MNPETPQNAQTVAPSVPAPDQFVKATPVVKFPSRYAIVGGQPAMLTWDNQNFITLQTVGQEQPEFRCAPHEIKRFFYMTDHTTISLRDGRKFMIGFNKDYLKDSVSGLGGAIAGDVVGSKFGPAPKLVGGAYLFKKTYDIYKDDVNNDSQWWVTTLAQYGAKTTRLSLAKVYGLTFLSLIAAFILVILIVA